MMDSWKSFGLERVLFGSDNFNFNNNAIKNLKSAFSKEEVELIGNLNPGRLLKAIGKNEIDNSGRGISFKGKETTSNKVRHHSLASEAWTH